MKKNDLRRLATSLSFPLALLSGCVVAPVSPDGAYAIYPPGSRPAAAPAILNVRLYPANDSASQSGILTGTVANTSSGKDRFQLNYQGETLVGEATRSASDSRRGIASAYGPRGLYMNFEYSDDQCRAGKRPVPDVRWRKIPGTHRRVSEGQ